MKPALAILAMSFATGVLADTELVDGIEWSYTISNGEATVGEGTFGFPAVPKSTVGNITIPSVLGGCPVTRIGKYAFAQCFDISDVTIPDSVTSIEEYGFHYSSLKSVSIPCSVTNIGRGAFYQCNVRSFLVDGNNPTYKSVNDMLLSKDGFTLINGVNGSAVIPDGVKSIADDAFGYYSGLFDVVIPEGVTTIGGGAFFATSLTSVRIPSSVTQIRSMAFRSCSKLGCVVFDGDAPTVGEDTFANTSDCVACVSSASSGWEGEDGEVWKGLILKRGIDVLDVDGVEWMVDDGVLIGMNLHGETEVSIPFGVIRMRDKLFAGNGLLVSVEIPEGVTNIGYEAFKYCKALTSVMMPSSLTTIGRYAFSSCTLLSSLTIPDGVTSIGAHAFEYCESLESIAIPNGVVKINDGAFAYCSRLIEVTIPDSVAKIGVQSFYCCDLLANVAIPNSVTNIGAEAFSYCRNFASVTIPNSVVNIGPHAFFYCSGLTNVWFDGNAPTVENFAFDKVAPGCVAYVRLGSTGWGVDIPGVWEGLRICYMPFVIDDGVLVSVELNGNTDITIPSDVTAISSNAFARCANLSSIVIPESVETISPLAFNGAEKLWAKWFRTLERLSSEDFSTVMTPNEVALTVTNVVVHYVTTSVQSGAVTPPTATGIVNIISEVNAGSAVAISSDWATQYGDAFTEKFGGDFTKAITKPTGKRDGAGNELQVWQDFVAGTDPTDENDKFTASITFDEDGKPIIAYSPELTPAEAAKRKYTTYGKAKLTDKEWTEVAPGEEESYNFFKVTVEMR